MLNDTTLGTGYAGRVSLLISYQWETPTGNADAVLLSADFPNMADAYNRMEEIIPADYYGDDGYDLNKWADALASGDHDVFMSYNAQIDDAHNVLAVLRPII